MPWGYTIKRTYDNPVPNGTKYVDVEFSDGTQIFPLTGLKLYPANFPTPQKVADFLASKCAQLDAVSDTAAALDLLTGEQVVP